MGRVAAGLVAAALAVGCNQELPAPGKIHGLAPPKNAPVAEADPLAPLTYHGGQLLTVTAPVYFIYYGNWFVNGSWTGWGGTAWLLETFTNSLSGSPWMSINSDYLQPFGGGSTGGWTATNTLYVAGRSADYYSQGTALPAGGVLSVANASIASGAIPADSEALYVVVPTPDVTDAWSCQQSCGWHTAAGYQGQTLHYIYLVNPETCPGVCWDPIYNPSPNANSDGDYMANILAHEVAESVTDPNIDGYYDSNGWEIGDKCAWNFGQTWTTGNGAQANLQLGSYSFLVQQLWKPGNPGSCSMTP